MTATSTSAARTGWPHWWAVLRDTARVLLDPDTAPRCASTAFFGFLSFFPAIATVALIYGMVANGPLVAGTVNAFSYFLPAMAVGILDEQLRLLAAAPPAAQPS